MILINQLSLPVDHGKETLKKKAARILKVPEASIVRLHLVRRSIDARKKGQLLYSYIVDVELDSKKKEEQAVFKAKNPNVRMERTEKYKCPSPGLTPIPTRPVNCRSGARRDCSPLFCWRENGYRPILCEQGDPVEEREKRVEQFSAAGLLRVRSLLQRPVRRRRSRNLFRRKTEHPGKG